MAMLSARPSLPLAVGSSAEKAKGSPWWWGWIVFGLCFVVAHLVYRGVAAQFLRAENSYYLIDGAHGSGIAARLKTAFAESYNGHYAPLVFGMELGFSALFGPRAGWWQIRQQFAVALLAFTLIQFFESVFAHAKHGGKRRSLWRTLPLSAGLAALFTLTPTLIDLVAWPFMVLQILWAAATVWSLYWLGRAADAIERADAAAPRYALWAALCGYGSLHCLGIGLATMGGVIVALEALALAAVWLRRPRAQCWRLFCVLNLAVALGGLHGVAMLLLTGPKPPVTAHTSLPVPQLAMQTLGFFSCFIVSCVRAVWSPNSWPHSQDAFLAQEWPYALAMLLVGMAAVAALGHAVYRRKIAGQPLRRLCWQLFSLTSLVMVTLLMELRAIADNNPLGNFLFGARYIWPGSILLIGAAACLLADRRWRVGAWMQAGGWIMVFGALTGNLVYQREVVPAIWPHSRLSHQALWDTAVRMTRELRAASLPTPNLTINTQSEFALLLREYEPLLRRSLGLPESQPLLWAERDTINASLWEKMRRRSPSLDRLQIMLTPPGAPLPPPLDPESAPAPAALMPTQWDRALLAEPLRSHVTVRNAKSEPHLGVNIPVGSVTHRSIWNNPPAAMEFRDIDLDHRSRLRGEFSIHPAVWAAPNADGAVFQISVRPSAGGPETVVWRRSINPIEDPAQRTWMEIYVDLSKYEGQRIDLILTNLPGPANNDFADWCLWGEPFLTAPDGMAH